MRINLNRNGRILSHLALCTICLVGIVVVKSCSSGANQPPVGESTAFFDSFTYQGNDAFYAQNPLTSPDQYFNPILPGWYSDPSICRNGEDYFLVTSTFTYFPGVPIFHSTDMVNWKQIGHVLDRESQLVNMPGQHVSGGIFAPSISYNPHNQTYYMITTNVGAGNFFVKTKDPFGSWSDPISLPEVTGIDPSFFFDEDGKAYIVNNDDPEGKPRYDGHRAIRVQQFDVDNDKTFGPRKVLIDGGIHPEKNPIWIEGPHMYKINGEYFLMAAEGGTGPDHSEVILRAKSPMGPFKAWNKNPILTQRHLDNLRAMPITCAGHADLLQTANGDWWAVFLACRPIGGQFENLGRETFMMPVRWSDDGFPFITEGEEVVPMIGSREGVVRGENPTFGNFTSVENFDSTKLGYEWMTLRTSAEGLYSLTENPGYLSLKCSETKATEKATPSFVCRRIQHHEFESSTTVYFDPANETESAGLLIFKDESHQYFMGVKMVDGKKCVVLDKISREGSECMASNAIRKGNNPVQLKVVSQGKIFDFFYADGKSTDNWQPLAFSVDAAYLSSAVAGGFTGTTIGLYAVK